MENSANNAFLLLPGYELDGYPRTLGSQAASNLLSGWLALWHPALIAQINCAPSWIQAENFTDTIPGSLVVIPELPELSPDPAFQEAEGNGEIAVLRPESGWRTTQANALKLANLSSVEIDEKLIPEFAALGYAYLQIQLMTRQLRYTSNLDQLLFSDQVCQAAEAALAGEIEKAQQLLQSCFDSLGQERDHYYSLDVSLLDITLLADSTLGKSLDQQLAIAPKTTYLASASLLRLLPTEKRQSLLEQTESGKAAICGGLDQERPHTLLCRDSVLREYRRGQLGYEELGFSRPKAFSRLSFGFLSEQASDLQQLGFDGAMMIAWTGGSYPEGSQAKMSWESSDGNYLATVAAPVFDASNAASYLALGWEIGEALDHQHVPTLLFAHWPNQQSEFYELLQIISDKTPALGRWSTVDEYFKDTDEPYHQERLSASGFRYPWMSSAESPQELIDATKLHYQLSNRCRSLRNLSVLAFQIANAPHEIAEPKPQQADEQLEESGSNEGDNASSLSTGEDAVSKASAYSMLELENQSEDLSSAIEIADSLLDAPDLAQVKFAEGAALADQAEKEILARLSSAILGKSSSDGEQSKGLLLLNPRSTPARTRVGLPKSQYLQDSDWKFASSMVGHDRYTSVDLPSLGFVAAPIAASESQPKLKPLAQSGGLLQNEFLEAQVDIRRGHLLSLHIPGRRGNRLSLMLARRDKTSKGKFEVSKMVASDVQMLTSSGLCGLIRAKGKLDSNGAKVGEFEIDYEVWRGNRVLEVTFRLSSLAKLADANPWKSAYVARLAWPMESAIVRYFSGGARHAWGSGQAIAPELIEIDETDYRTQYLTGGLAFHRRTETRFLESILSANSADSEHRIGIGVDLPSPIQNAADFYDKRYSVSLSQPVESNRAWLISCDVKNVAVDLKGSLVDEEGRCVGVRLGLFESDGKSTSANIRLLHNVRSASRVDLRGNSRGPVTSGEDKITVAMRSNESCLVDVLWKK